MRLRRSTLAKLIALRLMLSAAPAQDEPERPRVDLRSQLTEAQQEWWSRWDDPDLDCQALLCGRRAGKSRLLSYWLVQGAIDAPRGSWCVYISTTKEHAEQAMWQHIKDAATESNVPHTVSETRLRIRFAGGGQLMLAGSDTKREINKYRSKGIYRAAVDECSLLKASLIKYLEEDVLEPACMDYGGKRAYAGTPGMFPLGWWWEVTRPDLPERFMPVGRWTAARNPHIAGGAEAYFERTRKRKKWAIDHPTFVREYLGQWHMDIGELVFPVDPQRNAATKLPTHTDGGAELDPSRWRYSIGIDLGYVHASAFVVVAAHPGLAERVFVLESEKHVGWLTPQIRDRLRQLRKKYPRAVVVADTGGYGKPIVEELRRLWGESVEAAKKTDKAGQIRIVRDALMAGTLQLIDGECNDALRSEWGVMGWDADDKTKPSELAEDHASDATLYAIRRLQHYTRADAPAPLSPEEQAAEERRRKFAALEKKNRAKAEGGIAWLISTIKNVFAANGPPPRARVA